MRAAALSGRSTMQPRSGNKRAKDLRALLAGSAVAVPPDIGIVDLTLDSRSVQFGGAFIALPGTRTHGIGFAAQAVNAGARAILWEPTPGSRRAARARQRAAARRAESHRDSRHDRRSLLRCAVADRAHGRRDWHERQDDNGVRHRDCDAAARHGCRVRGHDRLRPHRCIADSDAHDAGFHHGAPSARRTARRRCAMSRDGSVVARARPASRRRGALRYRGVHQPDARSPGLSRHVRELRGREGQVVRVAAAEACGHQCGRCIRAHAAEQLHAHCRPDVVFPVVFRPRSAHASPVCGACGCWCNGPGHHRRRQLGRRDAAFALHRRLQRREPARVAGRAARLERAVPRCARGARALQPAAGTHGDAGRHRQAARDRRLCTYTRCLGESCSLPRASTRRAS